MSDTPQKVAMIGLGYIGLPTAAVMARAGYDVLGVDTSQHVVDTVNSGRVHIEENDLDALVSDVVARGKLTAALAPAAADVFVIAVPTPFHHHDHKPDVSYVLQAARTLAPALRPGGLVIVESTSPVGTTEQVRDILATERPDLRMPTAEAAGDIGIAYCPERVLPGRILHELVANDRVIGGISADCATRAASFYRRFVDGACMTTIARVAEMTKLTENAFRDVNIAFANELSIVSDRFGLDVWEVIRFANRHPRVNILQPGPGVGGHCIAVDPWFIVDGAPDITPLIQAARGVNDGKVDYVVDRAAALAGDDGAIACLGLAFKANIDDLRESPALEVTRRLAERFGARVRVCEPFVQALPEAISGHGAQLVDLKAALACETIVLLVDHDVFKAVPAGALADRRVYDTRGIWVARD